MEAGEGDESVTGAAYEGFAMMRSHDLTQRNDVSISVFLILPFIANGNGGGVLRSRIQFQRGTKRSTGPPSSAHRSSSAERTIIIHSVITLPMALCQRYGFLSFQRRQRHSVLPPGLVSQAD